MSSFLDPLAGPPIVTYPAGAGGTSTRVLECGGGDDVVVLLHGSGARADRWRRNLPALAAGGRRAIALDLPGHGFASKGPGRRYDAPAFAAFVADLLDAIGVGEFTLVGSSLGGHVAALCACSNPDRVGAAVLVGSLGIVPVRRDPEQTSSRVSDTSAAGVEAKLRLLLYDSSLVSPAWVEEERRINTSPGAPEALGEVRHYLETGVDADLVGERYAALGIPTLLVWGTDDRWVAPRFGHAAAEVLASPLVLLERSGHAPYLERAEAFNSVVAEFLRAPRAFPAGVQSR